MTNSPHIAIVGAGFSGAALAIHLLHDASLRAARVQLIERPGRGLGGVAYDVSSPHLSLNVPARRMSVFPDRPEDFLEFLRERAPDTDAARYAQRREFRDYLVARLDAACADARARSGGAVTFERLDADVVDVNRDAKGRLRVALAGADAARASAADEPRALAPDIVALATGNVAPQRPAWLDAALVDDPRFRDAWAPGAVAAGSANDTVVLVGTGLTTVDLVVELRANGFDGRIVAVSRHGLLPRVDDGPPPPFVDADLPPECGADTPPRARALLRALRRHADVVAADGRDWRSMINAVRERVPALWAAMAHAERARFLRHARSYWEIHRHRVPIALARKIGAEISSGRLEIVAGRVLRASRSADGRVALAIRERGADTRREIVCERLVNCTGAGSSAPLLPPWTTLLARGAAARDAFGLGVLTDDAGRVLDATGIATPDLFYAGPMWRAQHWEATAVPDLRERVHGVARAIAQRASAVGTSR